MLNSVYAEINVFACCFLLGIIYGIIFDLFKVLRYGRIVKKVSLIIQDIVYFIIITAITFKIVLFVNGAQLRIYMPLAAIISFVLYRTLLSKYVVWFLLKIKKVILFTLKILFKIIVMPIFKIVKFLFAPIFALKRKVLRKKVKFALTFREICFKIKCKVLKLFGGIKICKERKPCQRK